jgi:hypothetical protein
MASRITFVHIPKTGGTSFIGAEGINYVGHKTGSIACARYPGTEVLFAVFRDPVARFISAYNYVGMENSYWHQAGTSTEHPDYRTVKEYAIDSLILRFFFSEILRKLFSSEKRRFLKDVHWNRQHSYLTRPSGVDMFLINQNKISSALEDLEGIVGGLPVVREVRNKSVKTVSSVNVFSRMALRLLYHKDFSLYRRLSKAESGWIKL